MQHAVCFIAGPTASGKSDFALALAKRWSAEIVNADSMQIYSDLDVLTARPSKTDQAGIPHHLYGHIDGSMAYDAAKYAEEASALILNRVNAGTPIILVGGTGLYFKALLEGFASVPDIPEVVRSEVLALAEQSAEELYTALSREDPVMAARLNLLDRQRVGRALEVIRATGKSLSEFQAQDHEGPLGALDREGRILKIRFMPDRDKLYARCNARFDKMIDGGALEEVEALMKRQLSSRLPVMRALGVSQLAAYLSGQHSLEEASDSVKMHTRRFAKRQLTWMRNQFDAWKAFNLKYNDKQNEILIDKITKILLTTE